MISLTINGKDYSSPEYLQERIVAVDSAVRMGFVPGTYELVRADGKKEIVNVRNAAAVKRRVSAVVRPQGMSFDVVGGT